jgi:hypothetical protein
LWNHILFYLLPISIILIIIYLFFIVRAIIRIRRDILSAKLYGFFILITFIIICFHMEMFKAPPILRAKLVDDLSYLNLTLREGGVFDIHAVGILRIQQRYSGTYYAHDDTIIFYKKPYPIILIPDTTFIINDKLVIKFKNNGEPDTSYTSDYFKITWRK